MTIHNLQVSSLLFLSIAIGDEPDFVSHNMSYTFTPGGPTEIIIPIRILDDFLVENTEALSTLITLSTDNDMIDLNPDTATIRIIDDDRTYLHA